VRSSHDLMRFSLTEQHLIRGVHSDEWILIPISRFNRETSLTCHIPQLLRSKLQGIDSMSDYSSVLDGVLCKEISDILSAITHPVTRTCLGYVVEESQLRSKDDKINGNIAARRQTLQETRDFCADYDFFQQASTSGGASASTRRLGEKLRSRLQADSEQSDNYGGYTNSKNLDTMHKLKVAVNAYLSETLQEDSSKAALEQL